MAVAFLGAQAIDEIHSQAILLWIHSKLKNESLNPAHGIYFAITNQTWPQGAPEVGNAIDLCSMLNQAYGLPGLSKEEAGRLSYKALVLFERCSNGRSPIHWGLLLVWVNKIAYALAGVSLLVSGFSWWVLGLIFAVWICFGAGLRAAQMERIEPRPAWVVPTIAAMYLTSLVALYAVSLLHLLAK